MQQLANRRISRREALALTLAAGATALRPARALALEQKGLITRAIPATGERLPVIGVGTNAFAESRLDELRALLKRMVELGGSVIDTAPVYGESEQVIGELVAQLGIRERVFLATKLTAGPMDLGPPNIDSGIYGEQSLARSLQRLRPIIWTCCRCITCRASMRCGRNFPNGSAAGRYATSASPLRATSSMRRCSL
jgi:hypothetical protein